MSKKFPVHTAIELQDVRGLQQLLDNECNASFHLERKLPDSQVSVGYLQMDKEIFLSLISI